MPPPVTTSSPDGRQPGPASGARAVPARVGLPPGRIEAFCRKWKVAEFALFGSVLRDDFRPDSDVDVLVTFLPGGGYDFITLPDFLDELSDIFGGRKVDVVEKHRITNPFRRHFILTTAQVVYAA